MPLETSPWMIEKAMGLGEIGCEDRRWIKLAQDRV
jgi:hypothetical protein